MLYNPQDLKERNRCEIRNEAGKLLYWGIYDFSYKYRTRIYDAGNEEQGYVQLDSTAGFRQVSINDPEDHPIAFIKKETDAYFLFPEKLRIQTTAAGFRLESVMIAERGKMEVYDEKDLLISSMLLFGMVLMQRGIQ